MLAARGYEGEVGLACGPLVESLGVAVRHPQSAGLLERVPTHHLSEASRLLPEGVEGLSVRALHR